MSESKYRELLQAGQSILSNAIGAMIGGVTMNFTGDPISGALVGSTASEGLRRMAEEISTRYLGDQEKKRVGALIIITANKLQQRLDMGEDLRQDDFFVTAWNQESMSDAEQIIERALLAVQRDPEESKLLYMGNLIANLCFDDSFDINMAHQLIKRAEELTYRQLCILKISALLRQVDTLNTMEGQCISRLSDKSWRDRRFKKLTQEQVFILTDCLDMYRMRLITIGHFTDDIFDIIPKKIGIIGVGVYLWTLMELSSIPEEDTLPILLPLK